MHKVYSSSGTYSIYRDSQYLLDVSSIFLVFGFNHVKIKVYASAVIVLLCIYFLQALQGTQSRDASIIFYLESIGADVNGKDIYGLTPLHFAAIRGNDVAALELLNCRGIQIEVSY